MRGLISRSSCLEDSKNYKSSKFLYQIIDTPLFQYFLGKTKIPLKKIAPRFSR